MRNTPNERHTCVPAQSRGLAPAQEGTLPQSRLEPLPQTLHGTLAFRH